MNKNIPAVAAALVLAVPQALAQGQWSVAAGAEYTTGRYGAAESTEVWYLPVTARYDSGRLSLKLTVPWLHVTGPGSVVGGNGSQVQVSTTAASTRRTEAGLGDVVAAAGYAVFHDPQRSVLLDLTGKIKFATADAGKGLGTGADDYSLQLDLSRQMGTWSAFGSLGWRRMGDPDWADFRDPWFASIGASYRLNGTTHVGAAYDYRQRLLASTAPQSEINLFLNHDLGQNRRFQAYLIKGLSDGSPDWGAGGSVTFAF